MDILLELSKSEKSQIQSTWCNSCENYRKAQGNLEVPNVFVFVQIYSSTDLYGPLN